MIPRINEYNAFAQRVYNIDPLKGGKYRKGQLIPGTNYQILNISRDGTYGRRNECGVVNHMQAMAVAPVDKKGKVDKSQITIAYAGTNFEDSYDRATDMDNIALGLKDLPFNEVTTDSQFTTYIVMALIGDREGLIASTVLIPLIIAIWLIAKYSKWMFKYIVWVLRRKGLLVVKLQKLS